MLQKNRGKEMKHWNKKQRVVLALIIALAYVFVGCTNDGAAGDSTAVLNQSESGNTQGEKIKVVTTVFPPYDFVRNIGGDRVEVKMLLAPGMESHTYEPTSKDMKAIANADLFIFTGSDNDVWVKDTLDAMPNSVNTFEMVSAIPELLSNDDHDHDHDHDSQEEKHGHEEDGHEEDGHEEDSHDHATHEHAYDEHVWTSPVNAVIIVNAIRDKLTQLDDENSDYYTANAESYTKELQQIDEEFRQVVDGAKRRTVLFGDRFPFVYMAHEYGLEHHAAFSGCSSETEVSPAKLAELINKVKEEQLPVVLKMELSNSGIAEAVAEPSGAKVLEMHSCHNLSKDEMDAGETYISIMKKNIEALKEALN